MLFRNAAIYSADFTFKQGGFGIDNGRFTHVGEACLDGIDLKGDIVIPGLIDIHIHGNSGENFTSNVEYEGLLKITGYLAKNGITSCLLTSSSASEDMLTTAYANAKRFKEESPQGHSYIHGIHMEGPFLSEEKKGAHQSKYLMKPDYEMFKRLNDASGGLVKIVCVAAELDGSLEFIKRAKKDAVVSIGHTNADYDQAKVSFANGASHITHLYNAMPPLLHRNPGVIGAAMEDDNVMAETICDGIHVHESMVRAAFKLFSASRICLISDNVSSCGLPDGTYEADGQKLTVKGRKITLPDGTIAGSGTCLFDCMKKAISFGIKPEDAIRCVTYNPAKVLNALDSVGTIENGKNADFVICDKNFMIKDVYIKGLKVS